MPRAGRQQGRVPATVSSWKHSAPRGLGTTRRGAAPTSPLLWRPCACEFIRARSAHQRYPCANGVWRSPEIRVVKRGLTGVLSLISSRVALLLAAAVLAVPLVGCRASRRGLSQASARRIHEQLLTLDTH